MAQSFLLGMYKIDALKITILLKSNFVVISNESISLTLSRIQLECFIGSSCMSVRVRVSVFPVTHKWTYVEWWNFAQIYLRSRSRISSSTKMGHAFDRWAGQTGDYIMHMQRVHNEHVDRETHSCGILVGICYNSFLQLHFHKIISH